MQMVAILLGCGLRRAELAASQVADLQQREKHWVFADLIGKVGHIRTVPIPKWVAEAIDACYGNQVLRRAPFSAPSTRRVE